MAKQISSKNNKSTQFSTEFPDLQKDRNFIKTGTQEQQLIKALEEQNKNNFENAILTFSINNIIKISNILDLIFNNFEDLEFREIILNTLIRRINNEEVRKHSENLNLPDNLELLRANCFEASGNNLLKKINQKEFITDKLDRYKLVISSFEKANKSLENLLNNTTDKILLNNLKTYQKNILKIISEQINNYDIASDKFSLAIYSFENRIEYLKLGHQNIYDSIILIAEIGSNSHTQEHHLKALNYIAMVFNKACADNNIRDNAKFIIDLIKYSALIYSKIGDEGKSKLLINQHKMLSEFYNLNKLEKIEETDIGENINNEKGVKEDSFDNQNALDTEKKDYPYNFPILKMGFIDQNIMSIRQKIQQTVLNPIQEVAAKGKWYKEFGLTSKILSIKLPIKLSADYGINGYLNDENLKTELGNLYNEKNLNIAKKLCFEAINIGIANGETHNPLCAVIFAFKYPELIQDIITYHPEYFVNSNIFKSSIIPNIDEYKKYVDDIQINKTAMYNIFFEENITSIILKQIESQVLEPIKYIIANQKDLNNIGDRCKGYFNDKYLKDSVLGQNLSSLPEVFNIAKLQIFNVICSSIHENGSSNLEPVTTFLKSYPALGERILRDHKDFCFGNKTIINYCKNAYNLAQKGSNQFELMNSVIIPTYDTKHDEIENVSVGGNIEEKPLQ